MPVRGGRKATMRRGAGLADGEGGGRSGGSRGRLGWGRWLEEAADGWVGGR
jgi:hypothetical protein